MGSRDTTDGLGRAAAAGFDIGADVDTDVESALLMGTSPSDQFNLDSNNFNSAICSSVGDFNFAFSTYSFASMGRLSSINA